MKQKPLFTVDGETLTTTLLPPVRFVVEGFLPQGLHLLAGASKIGKSWLALWLCLQVAKGEKVWDFPSRSGDVLYLCLEDNYSRIQSRLLDITDEAPGNLHFATASEKLRCGLEQQIQQFLAGHPHTVLVVIDTLQRVRGAGGDTNAYANDYRDLEALKALADGNHLAILLIHHLRKREDEDPMNMISGTMGISGATDSNFVLRKDKRSSQTATLYCTGRDISYRELKLAFDSQAHRWLLLDDGAQEEPVPTDPLVVQLAEFLRAKREFSGTATELSQALEPFTGERILPNVLMKRLIRHRNQVEEQGVLLETSRTREARRIRLSLCCDGSDGNDGKSSTASVSNLLSQPSQLSREKSENEAPSKNAR